MRTKKIILHNFEPSVFDEELYRLDQLSERGWQLTAHRVFWESFARDDRVVYRHGIDFQTGTFTQAGFQQYRTLYEDAGWEYVDRRRNAYFFRKPWDPARPEEEYLLYTDEPSFRQMKRSIVLPTLIVTWLLILLNCLLNPALPMLLILLGDGVAVVGNLLRRRRLRRARPVPVPYRRHLWRYDGLFLALCLLLSLGLTFLDHSDAGVLYAGPARGTCTAEFTMTVPELRSLSLSQREPASLPAEAVPPSAYVLKNSAGRTVRAGVLAAGGESVNLFLRPGTYTLALDWEAAVPPGRGAGVGAGECLVLLDGLRGPLANAPFWLALALLLALPAACAVGLRLGDRTRKT